MFEFTSLKIQPHLHIILSWFVFLISQLVQFFCRDEILCPRQVPFLLVSTLSAAFCEVLVTVVTLTASSFKVILFIYVWMCWVFVVWAFFLVGATLAVVHGLLIVVASKLLSMGSREHRL